MYEKMSIHRQTNSHTDFQYESNGGCVHRLLMYGLDFQSNVSLWVSLSVWICSESLIVLTIVTYRVDTIIFDGIHIGLVSIASKWLMIWAVTFDMRKKDADLFSDTDMRSRN